MNTKIKKIILRKCEHKPTFRGAYTTGTKDPEILRLIIGEIVCEDVSGFGECVPTSIYYEKGHLGRADIDEWSEIQTLAENLIGYDVRKLGDWIPETIRQNYNYNSIVDVLDFAIYDVTGKLYGVPVKLLLGGGREEVWKINVIHTRTPDEMSDHILEDYQRDGVIYFKLKPSGILEVDREILIKTAEKLPEKVHVFSDPNFALKVDGIDEVIEYLREMSKYGLEVCEDPVDVGFDEFKRIKEAVPVKIMLDMPSKTPELVMEIVRKGCADFINIHANWSGGFNAGILKSQIAAIGGLGTMIGSTNYLGIGNAAYQTLSSALRYDMPCEQANAGVAKIVENEYELKNGKVRISTRPGLGVDVDYAELEAVTTEKIEVC